MGDSNHIFHRNVLLSTNILFYYFSCLSTVLVTFTKTVNSGGVQPL